MKERITLKQALRKRGSIMKVKAIFKERNIMNYERQICRNLANVLRLNDTKMNQFTKIKDICEHLTSDDGITINVELYDNNIVRYLIEGTRCKFTCTFNALDKTVIRKPRNKKPFYTTWIKAHCSDILELVF